MTFIDLVNQRGLTIQKARFELSEVSRSFGGGDIYNHRLWRMRNGAKPTSDELRALIEWSDGECDCYKDA